jgi:hypothetical protein
MMARRVVLASVFLLSLLLLAFSWRAGAARAVAQPQPSTAPSTTPATQPAADAPFVYTAPADAPLASVVRQLWPKTSYMTRAEFEAELLAANKLRPGAYVKTGQQLTIPGYESAPIVEHPLAHDRAREVRAIYLTGTMAGSRLGLDLVRRWRDAGGNAVVFDIKDSDGALNVPFDHALAPKHSPAIPNLPKYVRWLHQQGMYGIARIALFRDSSLVAAHPELAVQSRRSGGKQAWRENGALVWTDSSHPAVQSYNLALAQQVARSGVDEVQFDYVRFPAEGDQKDAQFAFETLHPGWKRHNVITNFVARAYEALHPAGVLVSLDVFGVMAWEDPIDLAQTGQKIADLAQHCDVLSPMIYPSHFFGMEGMANPGDAPAHWIGESMDKFTHLLATVAPPSEEVRKPATVAPGGAAEPITGHSQQKPPLKPTDGLNGAPSAPGQIVIRPWLQAFRWRTKTYSVEYVLTQVQVAKEHGGNGFLFWNAANQYREPLAAMEIMRRNPGEYFHNSESGAATAGK